MSNCQTCRFWGTEREGYYDNAVEPDVDERIDGRIVRLLAWDAMKPVNALYKACGAIPMGPVPFSDQTSPGAVVMDGSEYYAVLRTTAEFGCALHSPVGVGQVTNDR